MSRFKTPLYILVLGLLPFWLFIGSTNSTTINGQVVQDSRFNIAGLILGLIGIAMAWKALRERGSSDSLRMGLIVVAALVCLVQIAHSTQLITVPI